MVGKLTEKQIETTILTYLNNQPDVFAFKINSVGVYDSKRNVYRTNKNRFVMNGCSDILGLIRGKFFAIEVKKPKGKSTQQQVNFLCRVISKGGAAIIARSVDDAIRFIEELRIT